MVNKDNVHLRDYLKIIKKRQETVFIVFCLIFGIAILGTFLVTPKFQGTTKVIIEKVEPSDLTGRYRSSPYDPGFYETQFQLIKSHAVARRVVDLLSLGDKPNPLFNPNEKSAFQTLFTSLKESLRKVKRFFWANDKTDGGIVRSKEDLIADEISEKISVQPIGDSRIISIGFLSPNPEFAAMVANTTAKAYIEQTLEMKMESTKRTLDWMTKKAGGEARKLEKAENALQKYTKENNIVTLENRVAVTPEKLAEISTQLVRATAKRKELEILVQKIKEVMRNPASAETISAIAGAPALQTLRAQIVESEKNIMELSGKYGPKHPIRAKALSDLQVLKQKKEQEINRIIKLIRNEYELALSNEANLQGELSQEKGAVIRFNEKLIQYDALKREMETNRQLFDALMLKMKEQSITEETQPVNLWIVEEAAVPTAPARPLKAFNLSFGLILGLVGGISLALFLEYLDNTVKNPEETEAVLGVPVLGVVSLFTEKNDQILEEIILKDPKSIISENYRALRTSVLLSSAEAPPSSILVSSPTVGEGKTTVSVNLALALAQSEKRVVLIDGDLRKPRLHKIFKISNEHGLSAYLAGAAGKDILKKGPLPNLAVIPSGPIPPNPSELLISVRMKSLLEGLQNEFDIIICDSPPLLSVADARVLSRIFSNTILVTRAHQTTYEMAGRALKSLNDINAHVLGMVINALDSKKGDYYHYGYGYYGTDGEGKKRIAVSEA